MTRLNAIPFLLPLLLPILPAAGCARTLTAQESPTGVPVPFELALLAVEKDQRQVYYQIDRDGTFTFGGGKEALIREGKVLGRLTPDQIRPLVQIIERHDLVHGKASPFAHFEHHRYELHVVAANEHCRYTTVDDRTPGMHELAAALFELQAGYRYRDILGPIQEAIDKSDGGVKKTTD